MEEQDQIPQRRTLREIARDGGLMQRPDRAHTPYDQWKHVPVDLSFEYGTQEAHLAAGGDAPNARQAAEHLTQRRKERAKDAEEQAIKRVGENAAEFERRVSEATTWSSNDEKSALQEFNERYQKYE